MQSTPAYTLIDAQSGLKFTKSPRWRRQKLLFLDIHDRCIKSTDMNGNVQSVEALPFLPGGFDVLADGGLIVGNAWQRSVYRWAAANPELFSDLSGIAGCCIGDGVVDGAGGMYVSDVGFNFLDPLVDPVPIGVLIYISVKGTSSVVAGELFSPGGIVISPDNGTLIVACGLSLRTTSSRTEFVSIARVPFGQPRQVHGLCELARAEKSTSR